MKVGNGQVKIPGKGTTPTDGRLMLMTAQHKNYEIGVTMKVSRKGKAGLLLYYSETGYTGVAFDGSKFYVYDAGKLIRTGKNPWGSNVKIKIHNCANKVTIYAGSDEKDWTMLAENLDVTDLNHNKLKISLLYVQLYSLLEKVMLCSVTLIITMQCHMKRIWQLI